MAKFGTMDGFEDFDLDGNMSHYGWGCWMILPVLVYTIVYAQALCFPRHRAEGWQGNHHWLVADQSIVCRVGDNAITVEEYQTGQQIKMEHDKLDANHDGKISREEWIARYGSDKGFDEYDLNGDGIIDADEYRKCKAAEIEFTKLDANHDGKISREEWIARYGSDKGFDEYDLNGDGIIDADEYRKCKAAEIMNAHQKPRKPRFGEPGWVDPLVYSALTRGKGKPEVSPACCPIMQTAGFTRPRPTMFNSYAMQ